MTLRVKDAVCDRFRADTGAAARRRHARAGRAHSRVSRRALGDASTSTRPASRSGSAAGAATRATRRCARTSPPGIVALSGWTGDEPFLDPMCGSGTIVARGGGDRARDRAGRPAAVRLRAARRVRRAASRPGARARRGRPSSRDRPVAIFGADKAATEVAQARAAIEAAGLERRDPAQAGERPRAPAAGAARRPGREPALRRAASARRRSSRRSIRSSATRSRRATPAGAATSSPPTCGSRS